MTTSSTTRRAVPYLFVSAFTIPFVLFNILPIVFSFYLSLTEWNIFGPPRFVGFRHYGRLFNDGFAWIAFTNSVWYAALIVPSIVAIALMAALYVNQRWPLYTYVRTAFFAPYVVSATVIGLVWVWMLDTQLGLFNHYLNLIGIDSVPWLTSPQWSIVGVSIASVWWDLGLAFILLLAALQDIPEEYYEAAEIDGANPAQRFWHITLPQMQSAISNVVTLQLIATLRIYSQVYLMTSGGPASSSSSVVFYIYTSAIRSQRYGFAAAVSVVFLAVVLLLTILCRRLLPEPER